MDTQENNNAVNENIRGNVPYLIWSSYDRLNIKSISKFEDFFVFDDNSVEWTGSIQSLHLFKHNFQRKYSIAVREKSANDFLYDEFNPNSEYAFSMIMSLKISEDVFCQYDIKRNQIIFDSIQEMVNKSFPNSPIECFYSLGEEDIVLITLGNSIDDFMKLIISIRNLYFNDSSGNKKKLCVSTNSFFVQNLKTYEENKIICKGSYANLYVALKKGISVGDFFNGFLESLSEEIKEKINSSKIPIITMMVGEYDVALTLSADVFGKELFNLYSASFNATSDLYKNCIKNSKTVWCFKKESSAEFTSSKKENYKVNVSLIEKEEKEDDDFSNIDIKIKDILKALNNKIKDGDKNVQYVYHNVICFLKEASLTFHSTTNEQWKCIVSKQISAFIELYKENENKFYGTEKFDQYVCDLNDVISDMRNSFSHINRSHELFYHIPITSLRYSGSFNTILLAYYNFINMLLEVAFKKPHNNTKQAKIVFFVYFGTTAMIKEKTYFKDSLEPDTTKLVGFELPYTALYNLEKYFISLTHEVYHLVAPYDRARRNAIVEFLLADILIKDSLIEIIANDLDINAKDASEYQLVSELVEKFYYNHETAKDFNISNISLIGIKVLVRKIIEQNNNGLLANKIENIYCDFINYCKDNNNDKRYSKICSIITNKINNLINSNEIDDGQHKNLFFEIDKSKIINCKYLIDNIAESICDTFMYQMSFSRSNNPAEMYINYIKSFYDERNIDYNSNDDALFRIFLFVFYNELDISELKLEDNLKNEIKSIYLKLLGCYSDTQLNLIKNIINEDNLLYSLKYCYNSGDFEKILADEEKIKANYIVSLSKNSDFTNYIDIICSLNKKSIGLKDIESLKTIKSYEKINLKPILKVKNEGNLIMPTKYANDLDEYLRIIFQSSLKNADDELWFRGICNYKYNLIPSLFVDLKVRDLIGKKCPYLHQIEYIRLCYNETKQYYTEFLKQEELSATRQSLMQHYGIPTNLLDFSTDPLASLYWALNPENKDDEKILSTAVVYIFYPLKYNKACQFLKEHYLIDDIMYTNYSNGIKTHNCLNDEYIIEKTSNEIINSKIQQFNSDNNGIINETDVYKKLPEPIVIPQCNVRINAQSGTFVAFNLLSTYVNGSLDYLALENIQKHFVELKGDKFDESEYFLERILINPSNKVVIKTNLKNVFNYSKKSVYPDLDYLLSDVKKKMDKHSKS